MAEDLDRFDVQDGHIVELIGLGQGDEPIWARRDAWFSPVLRQPCKVLVASDQDVAYELAGRHFRVLLRSFLRNWVPVRD